MKLAPALLALTLLAPGSLAQEGLSDRELQGIVEEQDQLLSQLERLRSTMEVLLERLDAEGRPRTADLLRQAILTLDQRQARGDGGRPLTPAERMEAAREALEDGQLVRSLEEQAELVGDLEHLLSILLDRRNLEGIEDKLAELEELRARLGELANDEQRLRQETQALRRDSANEAQRALDAGLGELIERERSLLAENERVGRDSGTLELEELERELSRLLRDQHTDAEVLEAWDPTENARLEAAREGLANALREEERAARLARAASALRRAAEETRLAAEPGDVAQPRAALEEEARAADLARQTSGDEAAERASEALLEGAQRMARAESGEVSGEETARRLEESARELEDAARAAGDAASEARRDADDELAELSTRDTAAGTGARDVREELAAAEEAAAEGRGDQARAETERAVRALERARTDLGTLPGALSSSQAEQARRTERLERGLSTLPQAETPEGQEAREALERAAEAMNEASEASRRQEAAPARAGARDAEAALEEALDALGGLRQEAARARSEGSEGLAEAQRELEQQAAELAPLVPEGSMSPEAQESVQGALERAREAMERAAGELAEGRSSSAASSQRQALQELRSAQQSARDGTTPQTAEERQRAQEQAAEQERIREELLDLARRLEEREENSGSNRGRAERAESAAREATEALEQGALDQAEQKEQEVENELRGIEEELKEEEEQYQRLRDEEKLFRIGEEIRALLANHAEQMEALLELDGQRAPEGPPSRAQRLRLRRVASEEEAIGSRALEISTEVIAEGANVSGDILRNAADDLERVAQALSERGDYETGGRTQALQRDVFEQLTWVQEALQEKQRKNSEQPPPGEQPPQEEGDESRNLVPDTVELKLLRRLEIDVQRSVVELLELHPELSGEPEDVDPRVLRDVERLALRHERVTELFRAMRQRLGIPDPEATED